MNFTQLLQLKAMSDSEIIVWAQKNNITLSKQDVKILRKIAAAGQLDWLLSGIPDTTINELNHSLGKEKVQRLLKLLQ